MSRAERHEAREWLRNNANESAFASNRFGTTDAAAAFVEQLYALGAPIVHVTNIYREDWRIQAEGGPYADMLIVQLPDDATQRDSLFVLYEKEMKAEGFDAAYGDGQQEIILWWD